VNSNIPANGGTNNQGIASPKLNLAFGPWSDTEFYLNGGFGYHSNDGRGTTIAVGEYVHRFRRGWLRQWL
jgi:hypothetical protein